MWTKFDQAFKIKDNLKSLIYAVIRCPVELLDLMKQSADLFKWCNDNWFRIDNYNDNLLINFIIVIVTSDSETQFLCPAWTLDNLADDYFVPGHFLGSSGVDAWWRNVKASQT